MPILGAIILGLIFWAVITSIHRLEESDSSNPKTDSAIDILKRRYAQGEIDKEEYETKKKDLM